MQEAISDTLIVIAQYSVGKNREHPKIIIRAKRQGLTINRQEAIT